MFQHLFAPPQKEKRQAGERQAGVPHRLAAVAAPPPLLGDAQPHSPNARLAAKAVPSSSLGSPRNTIKAAPALPAFGAAVGSRAAAQGGSGGGGQQRLPYVRQAVGPLPSSYDSLEHLQKLAELHKGKHSTVHSYLDTRTGQLVCVKTYYRFTMKGRHHRNVRREIAIGRLLATQRFTGAVHLLGTFGDEGHIYLVQESCQGGDLYRRLVRAGGVMGEAEVCRDVVVPLLLTLTFLHANHIVHRDIKPENLFFTADGGLRLGDFGLSIDAAKERPTSRVGTLDYMAPEVVGMPSPDDIQRMGLERHQIGHYGCKVDVWAVGILTYELLCGRPPFEVEDLKLTEQHIKFSEVAFPSNISPACRSFIQQALTKRPESRPSAAQLFKHPWVQSHYRQMLAGEQEQQQQQTPYSAAAVAAAAGSAALAYTPELRRTVSQPPSPSKSMPEEAAAGSRQAGGGAALTPWAVAAGLAPFLPLSQAKMAHKVRLLSPGRPPSSSKAVERRRRVSDPLARAPELPLADHAAAAEGPAAAAADDGPPGTPEPAAAPAAVSDSTGAAAAVAAGEEDAASSGIGQVFEMPGTPGNITTPLNRARPVLQQRYGPLVRTPFLLSTPGSTSGSGSSSTAAAAAEAQPFGLRKAASPKRSRFASAAALAIENDEMHAAEALSSPGVLPASPGIHQLQARSASLTSLARDGSSSSLAPAARSCSFTSFGVGSSGNLQMAGRAASFTSFGGSSSGNILQLGSRHNSSKGLEEQPSPGAAGPALEQHLQRLQL